MKVKEKICINTFILDYHLILVVAEILVRYSGKSFLYSYLYYFIPLISIPVFYYLLFRQFYNENLLK